MSKITINKKISYYNKKQYTHADTIPEKKTDTIDDALEYIKQTPLHYVNNPQGITAREELYFITGTADHVVKYTKTIDPDTGSEHLTTPGGEA